MKSINILLALSLLVTGCSDESTRRSDKPVSRAAALKQFYTPLPGSAHDIYFLDHAGGIQDFERYVRFDVPAGDLDAAVDALIAENNKTMKTSRTYPREPLVKSTLGLPRKEFLPLPWWNPFGVTHGYFRGYVNSFALQIIVDADNSRVYLYQND